MQGYKYKDKFLGTKIASELILEIFDKQLKVSRKEIVKKVKELHCRRGGFLNSDTKDYNAVSNGLDRLKWEDPPKVTNRGHTGFWTIDSNGLEESAAKYFLHRIHEHTFGVRRRVILMCTVLMTRAITHDNSKYSESELDGHISQTDEMRGIKYGTDAYYAIKKKYEPLSAEHFANNRHHPEHHPNGIDDMTLVDVIEMLCDWLTGSEDTGTPVERSLEINEERYRISPQLMKVLKNTIRDFDLE